MSSYRANWSSQGQGRQEQASALPFQAASDADAEAIATAVGAALQAQETSLTRYIDGPSDYGVHSLGSQYVATVRLTNAAGEFQTFNIRNVTCASSSPSDLAAAASAIQSALLNDGSGILLPSGATPDLVSVVVRPLPRSRGT